MSSSAVITGGRITRCLPFPRGRVLVQTVQGPWTPLSHSHRGHQKIQFQQKNAKRQAEAKKSKGHDQKAAAKAALVYACGVCQMQMPDPKTFKQHFDSKHLKCPRSCWWAWRRELVG
ncbi:zinc finger protein 706 [Arapaima gigas]